MPVPVTVGAPFQVIVLPPIITEPWLVAFVAVVELLPSATDLSKDA